MWTDVSISCADGYRLSARLFSPPATTTANGCAALIAPATGVRARYYWRYAEYLAARGLEVLVPDYRGIGRSAPPGGAGALRRLRVRWHEWGSLDVDACLRWMRMRMPSGTRLRLVGHSFGGIAALLAPTVGELDRLMLVGAQHAHWRDYDRRSRFSLVWKWHLVMPTMTLVAGYFPGRAWGWLEDLPRGVVRDWASSRADYAETIGRSLPDPFRHAAAITFEVLAVSPTDDPFATPAATRRTLSYLPNARVTEWRIAPADLGASHIGHFGLFHQRFEGTFWARSAEWLTTTP